MPGFGHLLRCVGKAAVKNAAKALCSLVPLGEYVYDVARDTYEDFTSECGEAQLRAELQALAQASATEVKKAAEEVAEQEAAGQPPQVREALAAYLGQLNSSVKQPLRRPSDPGGTTVPAGLALKKPEDLMAFLPAGLPRFRAGDRPLAADWELVELLGKGGFGEVWKAKHLHQTRRKPVALKFCLDPVAAATLRNEAALHDVLERVREEASAPGIVPLLETYLANDPPCLMYEFIEGGDLSAYAQEKRSLGGLTPSLATRIVHRLASIVALAHRLSPPLVHRDLKMSNVLLRGTEAELPELFVADFGIGGLAAGAALKERASVSARGPTMPTVVRGAYTPLYASPQQVAGDPPDPRDDVHALGVLWYQLVTGDFKASTVPPDWREVVEESGLDSPLVSLLSACMASRAEKRPAAAGEVAERLALVLSSPASGTSPVQAPVTGPPTEGTDAPTDLEGELPGEEREDDEDEKPDKDHVAIFGCVAGVVVGVLVGSLSYGLLGALIGGLPGLLLGVPLGFVLRSVSRAIPFSSLRLFGGALLSAVVAAALGWLLVGSKNAIVCCLAGGLTGGCLVLNQAWRKKRKEDLAVTLASEGRKLAAKGQHREALSAYREALALDPALSDALVSVAWLLLRAKDASLRDPEQALEHATRVCQSREVRAPSHLRPFATVLVELDKYDDCKGKLEEALAEGNEGTEIMNSLAWLFATSWNPKYRGGDRAVRLATRACELTEWKKAHMLDTLAAAHAEAGQFDDAVERQRQAMELASKKKKADYESRLLLYQRREPYRESDSE